MKFVLENNILVIDGDFTFKATKKELNSLRHLSRHTKKLDFSKIQTLDYAAAYFLRKYFSKCEILNANEKILSILRFVEFDSFKIKPKAKLLIIEMIGKNILLAREHGIKMISFIGEAFIDLVGYVFAPWKIRFRELSNFIKEAGISAIFIVCLTAFLIGIVLAYQGAVMLERFNASVLVVDIMGIITFREIAPLIAAIVVAGRSASSFAAQIGVMKITEEIYAMKTMGFTPFSFVVMPRILALTFVMPVVIICADFVSIFGQMCVCSWYLGLDFLSYLERFSQNVELVHFWVGLIKAPVFGAVIALIGCMRGYEVDGSTQSVGVQTTKAVVNAIFWIIAIDAAFSVIFTELDI